MRTRPAQGNHLLLRLGTAKTQVGTTSRLVEIRLPAKSEPALKGDLSIRQIHPQEGSWKDSWMEAHIFVAFQGYCLQVTLQQRLRALDPA